MWSTNISHSEGELAYKPASRDDGKPEWGVFLVWSDGFERAVYNGRTGEPKRFRLADSLIKFHQSVSSGRHVDHNRPEAG